MAKFSCNGTSLKYGTAGGAPASTAGQVESGDADFGELNMTEVNTLDTSRDEHVPGTHQSFSFSVTVTWDPADVGHAAIMTAYTGKTKVSAGFAYSDTGAAVVYSDGYWTNCTVPVAVNGKLSATFSFRGTGALTFTP
jgi:hypothetical protein